MNNNKTRRIVYTGLFSAIVCVVTMLHIPAGNGYIHVGDAIIYLGAVMLPFPFGVFAAGIGGTLSDLLSGFAIYAIPTFIVKSLNALCFYIPFKMHSKIVTSRSIIAVVVSSFVTIGGYFLAEWVIFGKAAAIAYLARCYVQPLSSLIVFILLGISFDKIKLLNKINL